MVANHVIARLPDGTPIPKGTIRLAGSDLSLIKVPASDDISDPIARQIEVLEKAGIFAEPDFLVFPSATRTPDDPSYNQLWGMSAIDAPTAWHEFTGDPEIVVGVIDTGIDRHHPDIQSNIWSNPGEAGAKSTNGIDDDGNGFIDDQYGWNFYHDNNDSQDVDGHGSHCAGTIGASGNNATGVAGIVWNVRLVPMKFIHGRYGSTSDAIRAVEYATRMGVPITNNSWGGGGFSVQLKTAIDEAGAAGMVFVAAAGNHGRDADTTPSYPPAYDSPNIISVAAQSPNLDLWSHTSGLVGSNFGARSVDIAAPGHQILSTVPGGYDTYTGTSMAAPHVTGSIALLKGRLPHFSPHELKQILLDHARPLTQLNGKCLTGGMLSLGTVFSGNEHPLVYISSALACGPNHFLKLNEDGSVTQWGGGQAVPTKVRSLTDAIQVSAGQHGWSIALRNDGTVVQWSENSIPSQISSLSTIVEISAGSSQLITRRSDGTVWTVGTSYVPQGLGDGSSTSTNTAVQLQGIDSAAALASGHSHQLVLLTDGTLVSWGYNHSGQLGDGTTVNRIVPVAVSGITNVKAIAASTGTLQIGSDAGSYILGNQGSRSQIRRHRLELRIQSQRRTRIHHRPGRPAHSPPDSLAEQYPLGCSRHVVITRHQLIRTALFMGLEWLRTTGFGTQPDTNISYHRSRNFKCYPSRRRS